MDNTNKGALFKNDRKEKDTHPDYKGSINIDGKDYWLSAWVNTAKNSGAKYFGLSVQPKEDQGTQSNQFEPPEDLPF